MASPLGHSLCGVLLGEALRRPPDPAPGKSRLTPWLPYLILANAPDVDFIIGYLMFGDAGAIHSGFTHTLLFALTLAGIAALAHRRFPVWPPFWMSLALVGSHLVLDAASGKTFLGPGYGVMLFYPLSMERIRTPIALLWGPKHHTLAEVFGMENALGMLWDAAVFLPPVLLLRWRNRRKARR
jgi:inner membrane protein